MISRLRDGTPVESYDGQGGIIRFLYGTSLGQFLLKPLIRPGFSRFMGRLLSCRISRWIVPGFIRRNRISMEDYPEQRYASFNDFFTRSILPGKRPVDMAPAHLVAPCDSKLTVIPLTEDVSFSIKGVPYTAQSLLRSEALARQFSGGYLLLFRLTVDDYHHYIYPVDGYEGAAAVIPGSVVQQVLNPAADIQFIRIGHPGGVLECGVDYEMKENQPVIEDTFGFRTANLLLEGTAVIRQ